MISLSLAIERRPTQPHAPEEGEEKSNVAYSSKVRGKLWVASDYLEGVQLDQLTPMPDSVEARGDGFVFTFLARSSKEGLTVSFDFTPEAHGLLSGRVSLDGGERLSFRQFFSLEVGSRRGYGSRAETGGRLLPSVVGRSSVGREHWPK